MEGLGVREIYSEHSITWGYGFAVMGAELSDFTMEILIDVLMRDLHARPRRTSWSVWPAQGIPAGPSNKRHVITLAQNLVMVG